MTCKDYILIAKVFNEEYIKTDKSLKEIQLMEVLIGKFSDIFKQDNNRFNRVRFVSAIRGI